MENCSWLWKFDIEKILVYLVIKAYSFHLMDLINLKLLLEC